MPFLIWPALPSGLFLAYLVPPHLACLPPHPLLTCPPPAPCPRPPPHPRCTRRWARATVCSSPASRSSRPPPSPLAHACGPTSCRCAGQGAGGGRGGGLILCSHLSTPRLFWGLGVGGGHFGAALCFGSTSRQPWVLDPHQGSLCLLGCYTWHAQVRILVRIRHHHHHQVFFSRFRFSWAQGAG